MQPAGFEPAIPASELPQTHALDRATTGIGYICTHFSLDFEAYITSQDNQVANLRQVKAALGYV